MCVVCVCARAPTNEDTANNNNNNYKNNKEEEEEEKKLSIALVGQPF